MSVNNVPGGQRRGGVIIGWGTALPDKIVTNTDLQATMDTTHDWIVERTGIHERRVGGTTTGLAVESGRMAIERAGVDPSTIDQIIVSTTSPDQHVPAVAPVVQHQLGLTCGAFDLNAACSGFVYGLVVAHGLIAIGAKRLLLIGSETLTRYVDWTDRGTGILFADGAGAVVIDAVEGPGSLLGWDLQSVGSFAPILYVDIGSTFQMEGKEVFRQAVRIMVDSANKAMTQAGVTADQIKLIVPHQANIRIIESACAKLGIGIDKVSSVLAHTGNTSSASIPLALAKALDADRVQDGDLVLLVGFGAGMTAASAILRWGAGS
ncbi:MAG: beta-ketoacyl-ACP synthase III [Acidimicrobiia bacterium]